MKRDQLAHILRAEAVVAGDNEVIVVGSQAILGSYDEDDLPESALASSEDDVLDVTTATLPDGWRERTVAYSPAAANGATGLCLEPHDRRARPSVRSFRQEDCVDPLQ